MTNTLLSLETRSAKPTGTGNWNPATADNAPIKRGDRLWWNDLNGVHAPRWVTVHHLDTENDLVACTDNTNTHYMAIPEELTTTKR